jgi:cellulose synthase/poly-beta-1,6-N-acetylglucosamine synthase-like glycosyltransferase
MPERGGRLRQFRHQAGSHVGRFLVQVCLCAVVAAVVPAVAVTGAYAAEPRPTPRPDALWTLYPLDPAARAAERGRSHPSAAQELRNLHPSAGERPTRMPLAATEPPAPALRGERGSGSSPKRSHVGRRDDADASATQRAGSLEPLLFVALGSGLAGVVFVLLAMRTPNVGVERLARRHAVDDTLMKLEKEVVATTKEAVATAKLLKRLKGSVNIKTSAERSILRPEREANGSAASAANGDGDGDGDEEMDDDRRHRALIPHYVSADTAPLGFAVTRSAWAAPSFLIAFALACAAVLPALPALTSWYADVVAALARVSERTLVRPDMSLSFRPFFVILIVLLSAFTFGSIAQRLRLLCFSLSLYVVSVLVLDIVLARETTSLAPVPFSPVGGIAAGFAGLLAIVISIFARYQLPEGVRISRRLDGSRRIAFLLTGCLALALALATAFAYMRRAYFDDLHIRFIGGLDSELVIFLVGLVCLLFAATVLDRNAKPKNGPKLSVAFLIPAFNEAHGITETIRTIDDAAAQYMGRCRLYVIDNGSGDATREVATRAIEDCRWVDGLVLESPRPGKAAALNLGLSRVAEDIVVRIDADTLVATSLLQTVVPWFWDPSVGGVSGLPLPKRTTPRWLYPLRIIEVYYGVAFLRVAQAAADGVMVLPGLIACYRGSIIRELGGFAEGINGEDADMSMRIGRLGYRVITDPTVHVHTEVPENLRHLREQRQRWARGLFHMAGRNMSTIWMCQGARGLWILPWSILNAARRSMMIPVLACALTVEALNPAVLTLREISVIAGFVVGLQLFIIAVLLLAHRQFRVLPFLPAYLLFRVFRAYVAFETVLTLCLKPKAKRDRIAATLEGTARQPRRLRPVGAAGLLPGAARPTR